MSSESLSLPIAGILPTTEVQVGDGTAGTPSLQFSSDSDTGIFRIGNDAASLSAGGTATATWLSTKFIMSQPVELLEHVALAPTGTAGTLYKKPGDPGLYWNTTAAGEVDLVGGGGVTTPLLLGNGTAIAPAFSFTSDTDTGLFSSGGNSISAASGGATRLTINTTDIVSTLPITLPGLPTLSAHAANKQYVDAVGQGLDVKMSVRATTTANIALTGTQVIDGVNVVAGNRVLVKDQTTASENGIYIVAAGAWSRSTDADENVEVTPGMFTFIEEGTSSGDSGWVLATDGTIIVGTTALSFTQFTGIGQVNAVNAGTGGIGVFDGKIINDLEFRNIIASSNRVTVALDAGNKNVTLDVAQSNIDHGSIGGLTDDDHTQYLLVAGSRAMTGGLNMGGQLITGISAGTAGAPAISFTGDADTGLYAPAANNLGISLAGVAEWNFLSDQFNFQKTSGVASINTIDNAASTAALALSTGDASAGNSGGLSLSTGSGSTTGNSGSINIISGDGLGNVNTGTVTIRSGNAPGATSVVGDVILRTGTGVLAATGGSIQINNQKDGGLINLTTANAAGLTGAMNLTTGNSTGTSTLSGGITLTTGDSAIEGESGAAVILTGTGGDTSGGISFTTGNLAAGSTGGTGTVGDIRLVCGVAASGGNARSGGNIHLGASAGVNGGVGGEIELFYDTVGSLGFKVENDGTLSTNTSSYESLVISDNDIPNRKFIIDNTTFKAAVRVATAAAGILVSDFENGDTVDGVVIASGDRILIKNQATLSENGVYVVNATGAPTRAADFTTSSQFALSTHVPVQLGTANGGTSFYVSTYPAVTGVNDFAWTDTAAAVAGDNLGNHIATTSLNMSNNRISNMAIGTAALPSISFNVDPNTGIYSPSADIVGVSAGGSAIVSFSADATDFTVATGNTHTLSTTAVGAGNPTGSVILTTAEPNASTSGSVTVTTGNSAVGASTSGAVNINTGSGVASGGINIIPGSATGAVGGAVVIASATSTSTSGMLSMTSGNASTSGDISIGTGTGTTAVGSVNIVAGVASSNGNGGSITIQSSAGSGAGTDGVLNLFKSAGSGLTLEADGTLSTNVLSYESLITSPNDIPNKAYVDSVATGLDLKPSVRVKTVGALPSYTQAGTGAGATLTADANGILTIDGVNTVLGDRILVDQNGAAAGADAGIYTVTTEGTAGVPFVLTRAVDSDENAEVTSGLFCFVEEGSTVSNNGYVLITDGVITVDTTSLVFSQFSSTSIITSINDLSDVVTDTDSIFIATGLSTIPAGTSDNTIHGVGAGISIISGGTGNTLAGRSAASSLSTGDNNTISGNAAAASLTLGNNNTINGSGAGAGLITGSGNLLLGAGASVDDGARANSIILGNSTATVDAGIFVPTATASLSATATTNIVQLDSATGQVGAAANAIMLPADANPAGNITGIERMLVYDNTDKEVQFFDGTNFISLDTINKVTASTADATVTTIATVPTTANDTFAVLIKISVTEVGTPGNSAFFNITDAYSNTAGTLTKVATELRQEIKSTNAATWDVVTQISGTDILVRVVGVAATNITWRGRVEVVSS